MSKEKFDRETKKVFDAGQALKDMTESKGWQIARQKLFDRAREYLSTMNIDVSKVPPQELANTISVNQAVARELILWVQEIQGDVNQHKGNSEIFKQVNDEYIINVEDLQT